MSSSHHDQRKRKDRATGAETTDDSSKRNKFEESLLALAGELNASDYSNQTTKKWKQRWERPKLRNIDPKKETLIFQTIEAAEGHWQGGKATIQLFGVTERGYSVVLHVTDFKHYLYVAAPAGFQKTDCNGYRAFLEAKIAQIQPAIQSISLVMRQSIYGFDDNALNPYIRITVTNPKFIVKLRSVIESGDANWKNMFGPDGDTKIKTYDNIQYILRFMIDCKVGILWFDISMILWLTHLRFTTSSFKGCHG